ncbi:hypothetical protein CYG48_22125 (plasmid) [Neorhizobium sp. SOG26]|nr:hypothetical protein CYG48_22125 [Neorhizobium sp. SOG26]
MVVCRQAALDLRNGAATLLRHDHAVRQDGRIAAAMCGADKRHWLKPIGFCLPSGSTSMSEKDQGQPPAALGRAAGDRSVNKLALDVEGDDRPS